jgi:N-acyl-L-homoserine lactone synthetase
VTSVGIERLLHRIKLPISRFGDGRVVRLGKVPSVVLWVDINKQCRDALYSDTFDGHQAFAA